MNWKNIITDNKIVKWIQSEITEMGRFFRDEQQLIRSYTLKKIHSKNFKNRKKVWNIETYK